MQDEVAVGLHHGLGRRLALRVGGPERVALRPIEDEVAVGLQDQVIVPAGRRPRLTGYNPARAEGLDPLGDEGRDDEGAPFVQVDLVAGEVNRIRLGPVDPNLAIGVERHDAIDLRTERQQPRVEIGTPVVVRVPALRLGAGDRARVGELRPRCRRQENDLVEAVAARRAATRARLSATSSGGVPETRSSLAGQSTSTFSGAVRLRWRLIRGS